MVVFPWRLMIIRSQKFYESEHTKNFNRLIDPRICYILNHLHHQHFLCILHGNNFQEIEHQIFPLKLIFIFQKVHYFFWRHNGSTLFFVLTWVVPPQDYNCRRVSLTYYLQTAAVSFACSNLAGVWHFQTADSSFVSSDFSFITFPYQSLVHFCVKKEWEVRGSENWKWRWIFVSPCETLTDCKASDTDVINYLPALSWHHLELHVELWHQPIPGKLSYSTCLKVVAVG